MANSYRKVPIAGTCLPSRGMTRWFKRLSQGRRRAWERSHGLDAHPKQFGDPWDDPRDGKSWFGDMAFDADRITSRILRK